MKLNVKDKILTFLKDNIEKCLHRLGLGENFLESRTREKWCHNISKLKIAQQETCFRKLIASH